MPRLEKEPRRRSPREWSAIAFERETVALNRHFQNLCPLAHQRGIEALLERRGSQFMYEMTSESLKGAIWRKKLHLSLTEREA
jgi:hypothetical protein